MAEFRVVIQGLNTPTNRGPGAVATIIDDAKDIGGSAQANGPGEMFFTLPMNHPNIASVNPLLTHYKVQRRSGSGAYTTIFAGLVDDYEASRDEVVFFGRDYLSLYDTSITGSNTSYSSQYVGQIIQKTITSAYAETDSRVNFITTGTIENTATTTIGLSSYQSRLEFMRQLADIAMADQTVRSIIAVGPRSSDTPSITFTENAGADSGIVLEYGGLVRDFFYSPGLSTLRTQVKAIGQKREGATLLFSTQSSSLADPTTYGLIAEPMLFVDVIDQAALDDMARRQARILANGQKVFGLSLLVGGIGPWEGYDLADRVNVRINRGIVSVDESLAVWGVEWYGSKDGSEETILSFDTMPGGGGGSGGKSPGEIISTTLAKKHAKKLRRSKKKYLG